MAKSVTKSKQIKPTARMRLKEGISRLSLPKLINFAGASELLSRVEEDARRVLGDIIKHSKKAQAEGIKKIDKIVQQAKKNGYIKSIKTTKQWKYVENIIKEMSKAPILQKVTGSEIKNQIQLKIRKIDSGKKLAEKMKSYVGDKILVGLYEIEAALKIPTTKDFQKLEDKVKKLQTEIIKISKSSGSATKAAAAS